MPSKQIATSTLWQMGSQITMAALSILTVKFVAIGLTKELAGNYNSAYGYLQLFGILADFGLYAVSVREVSKAKDKSKVLGALIVLRTMILIVSLGAALLLVWAMPQWRGTPLPMSVMIASLVPFFTLLAGIIRTVFQVNYKLQYVFLAEVTQRIITTGLIGSFIVLGVRQSTDLQHLHMMLFFGGVGAFILFVISLFYGNRLMKIRLTVDKTLIKDLAKKAAPFGLAYLCLAFYRQFDITMIAMLRPDFEIQNAYYGFVVRMADMAFLLPTFLLNSTLPVLSERDNNGEDTRALLGKTFMSIMLIGVTAFLFAALWSRPLIALLTTQQYLSTELTPGSDTALRLVSIPFLLNGVILYSFYVLLNRHVWKRLTLTLFGAAIISLTLNFILIPLHGFVGAAYTSIVVHVLLAAALLPQALKEMPMQLDRDLIRKWAIFGMGLGLGLALFKPVLVNELSTVIGLVAMTILMGTLGWTLRLHKSLL
ncbi:MAG: oligosaccharide flippase family protein [Candidatus Peribacter sp.]|nr:oligosaccharide flippase family protein [Candidatus Peribacter sp.]MBT4393085.1 oligosaccharide flippase family protein [Candidatus Peribacter sp.]MBT4600883.1 oligosaccharide flippase family protein [Candidatus Peribacter sp.]MBT5148986.1 oligosaccharide flippase family protein [Candidatus Peribacter sp.]MBT5638334.1 oligosaccharide flippase family protein [Candidatus Peribacter sp.]